MATTIDYRVERDRWCQHIRDAWTSVETAMGKMQEARMSAIAGIRETGKRLIAAKKKLPHGHFTQMIEQDMPFGTRQAQKLMSIAEHSRLLNTNHDSVLPGSVETLYQLSRLDEATFDRAMAEGKINPAMGRTVSRTDSEGYTEVDRVLKEIRRVVTKLRELDGGAVTEIKVKMKQEERETLSQIVD